MGWLEALARGARVGVGSPADGLELRCGGLWHWFVFWGASPTTDLRPDGNELFRAAGPLAIRPAAASVPRSGPRGGIPGQLALQLGLGACSPTARKGHDDRLALETANTRRTQPRHLHSRLSESYAGGTLAGGLIWRPHRPHKLDKDLDFVVINSWNEGLTC